METYTVLRSSKYSVTQKLWLVLALIITGLLSIIPFFWLYQKVKFSFGIEAAEIGLAVGVIFLLAWTTLGIFAGSKIDGMMREQKSIFGGVQKNKSAKILMRIWRYTKHHKEISTPENNPKDVFVPEDIQKGGSAPEDTKAKNETDFEFDMSYEEMMSVVNQPNRRGRPPRFGLDKWLRVAIRWESRDTTVDAFTLAEVITDILGANADGSPAIREQSYYRTWRPRAKKELERRAELKKKREAKISKKDKK
jgi:hypothetical protein